MILDLDIKTIKEKAILLVPAGLEDEFSKSFDEEMYLDLIENIQDYIAEGVVSYYLNANK